MALRPRLSPGLPLSSERIACCVLRRSNSQEDRAWHPAPPVIDQASAQYAVCILSCMTKNAPCRLLIDNRQKRKAQCVERENVDAPLSTGSHNNRAVGFSIWRGDFARCAQFDRGAT